MPKTTDHMEKVNVSKPIEEYPPVLQARHIRDILGLSCGKTYEILNSQKCPTIRVGKRMVVMRDSFIKFLYANEGSCLTEEGAVS